MFYETNTISEQFFVRCISLSKPCITYAYYTNDNMNFYCVDESATIKYNII